MSQPARLAANLALPLTLGLTLAVGLAACADESVKGGFAPQIALDDRGVALPADGLLTVFTDGQSVVRVSNAGNGPLELRAITVTSAPAGLVTVVATPTPTPSDPVIVPPDTDWTFTVAHVPDVARTGVALVEIETNPTVSGHNAFSFAVEVIDGAAHLVVTPEHLFLDRVPPGTSAQHTLSLLNTGNTPLVVSSLALTGHPGFSVASSTAGTAGTAGPWTAADAAGGVEIDPPLVVAPGELELLYVTFDATGTEPAEAALRLFSNDPSSGEAGLVVPLEANTRGPCLTINPSKVDFGAKLVGTTSTVEVVLTSCGDSPLTIHGIDLVGDDADAFTLGAAATPPAPLVPNASWSFTVSYTPAAAALFDANAEPLRDLATVVVYSDALDAERPVELRGFGTTTECPTAVIIIPEGEEVLPQTRLHLVGSQSFGPAPITAWEWTVQQPLGSQSVALPSAIAADPVFDANVAGTYVFRLRVWDSLGNASCNTAQAVVFVSPGEGLHIELLWHTPNDPDETDEGPVAGADLDLHFAHPFASSVDVDGDGAPDPWFDTVFDCFWFNPRPNWGSLDPTIPDDPSLDRDDTDGAGPENLNLTAPEDGHTYRVGVHYWHDHGYGVSNATVRVYVYGTLVFEWADVPLVKHDLWDVATIAWPSGVVTPFLGADGETPRITPNYVHPEFFQ